MGGNQEGPRVPLTVSLVGLASAIVYKAYWASRPVVPLSIVANRTNIDMCDLFAHTHHDRRGLVPPTSTNKPTYLLPVKLASSIHPGLYTFLTVIPLLSSGAIQGLIVNKTGKYSFVVASLDGVRYYVIPRTCLLQQPVRDEFRATFSRSLRVL
ncbi:hypothetical protein OF83DRAFT_693059 [Amylostereum chailletii]|nr:hypothetical protein OF83DRAFT_693059 [Amylostereum chailletii]